MLAIEWTNKQIRIVEGNASGENVKLTHALDLEVPDSIDATDPEAVGTFLRSKLVERGIKERRTVSCIDRRSVVLKVISVANIADSEIPNLVRLQAIRDLTLPIEETIVDYVRANQETELEDPQAVIAVVRTEIVSSYQRLFKAAGLRLEGLWPASLAHVRAAVSSTPTLITHAGEEHFLIVPYGDSIELCLLKGTQLLTSASRPLARVSAGTSAAEGYLQTIKRLQASLSGQYTEVKVQSVLMAGHEFDEELIAALREQFGADVIAFDPLRSMENSDIPPFDRGMFAGVVGSLVLASRGFDQKINFLMPKKPVPKTDRRRVAAILGIGVALFVGLVAQRYVASKTSVTDRAIANAKEDRSKFEKQTKALKKKIEPLAFIESWRGNQAVWLNIMRDLAAAMPQSEQLFVTRMTFAEGSGKDAPRAVIQMDAFADDRRTITNLTMKLAEEMGFIVEPGAIQPATRFPGYNWKYSATIRVPRDLPARQVPPTEPPSRPPNTDPDAAVSGGPGQESP